MKMDAVRSSAPAIPPELLHKALADLPEKYRLPLLLHHLEGRSQEETAALLGCGVSTAGMRLNRGRVLLRDRLAKRGFVPTAVGLTALLCGQASAAVPPAFSAVVTKTAMAALAGSLPSTAGASGTILALAKGAGTMLFWARMKPVALAAAAVVFVGGALATYVVGAGPSAPGTETRVYPTPAPTTAAPTPNPADIQTVTGTIANVADGAIAIQDGGKSIEVGVDRATAVQVDGQDATPADLKVGMLAMAIVPHDRPATEIGAFAPPTAPAHTHTATPTPTPGPPLASDVAAHSDTPQEGGTSTLVRIGPLVKPPTEIQPDMPTTAPEPTPAPPEIQTVTGTISRVAAGAVTVQEGSKATLVAVNNATRVQVSGKAAALTDLKVGMRTVAIILQGLPAAEIKAYMPPAGSR